MRRSLAVALLAVSSLAHADSVSKPVGAIKGYVRAGSSAQASAMRAT